MSFLRAFFLFLAASAVASCAGAITILVATLDLETVGFGMLIALWLIPSMILFLGFRAFPAISTWSPLGYWLPVAGLLLWMLVGWQSGGEGSGLAFFIGLILIGASLPCYAVLHFGTVRRDTDRC